MKVLKTFLLISLFLIPLYSQGLIKVNGFPIDYLGKYSLEFTEVDNKVIKAEDLNSIFLTLSNKEIKYNNQTKKISKISTIKLRGKKAFIVNLKNERTTLTISKMENQTYRLIVSIPNQSEQNIKYMLKKK